MSDKPSILVLDNQMDRKEIYHLLHRLPPAKRLGYLHRCCKAITDKNGNGLKPMGMEGMVAEAERCERGDERLTNAIYLDIVNLAANTKLDLLGVALDLERVARGQVVPVGEAKLLKVG